jgi:Cu(I)-responsive transcriptional regulator
MVTLAAAPSVADEIDCLSDALHIGQAAARSGVSAKMIRYYESVGLIRPVTRTGSNYRSYDPADVQRLRFIARGRELGFSLDDIAALLRLWDEPARSSAEVKAVALGHIAALDRKIAAMEAMRAALRQLTDHCQGDDRPACPIIDDLAGVAGSRQTRKQRDA